MDTMTAKRLSAPSRPPTRPTPKAAQVRPPSAKIRQVRADSAARVAGNSAGQGVPNPDRADVVTWRLLMLSVVGLLMVGLLAPTLRGALDQHRDFAALEAEYQEALAQSDRLDAELTRWEDPAFIESQARTRLNYVYQGDKVWRPIGTNLLAEDIDPATGLKVKQGIVGASQGQPWYLALLESIKVADGPVELPDEPEDLNALLPPRDE